MTETSKEFSYLTLSHLILVICLGLIVQLSIDKATLTTELEFEVAKLNNTRKAETDKLFFNRVPKVGSQTIISLLRRMQSINNFTHFTDSQELKNKQGERTTLNSMSEKLMYCNIFRDNFTEGTSYSKHISYLDFKDCGPEYKQPIYLNFVREPVQRVISWYYYIRAPWYQFAINENGTAYKDFKPQFGLENVQHLKQSYEDCVLNGVNECRYTIGAHHVQSNIAGSHFSQIMFFCGHENFCQRIENKEALSLAKKNVEEQFAVVGVLEEFEKSLLVMEHYIPRYFKGVLQEYNNRKQWNNEATNKNIYRPSVDPSIKKLVAQNMTMETEFYQFCKQRLHNQYLAIGL